MSDELTVDPSRDIEDLGGTGLYVRAKRDGKWDSVDIIELDTDSLYTWLRSRGGDNPWAENVVALILGHSARRRTRGSET